MSEPTTAERRLAIGVGILILIATTHLAIRKGGGYGSDYSFLLIALGCGVVTGAYIIGRAWEMSRAIAIVIMFALGAGESYNLWQTAERVMNGREEARAPARAALKQHEEAEAALKTAEAAAVTSAHLSLALQAAEKAKAAYERELREGGRCRTICNGLKVDAERAGKEVTAALSEAEGMKLAAIDSAKADLAAHPLPASGTASSDETGIPVWVLDLISAVLLSLGANGLAGAFIAFGAHRSERVADSVQTDFDPTIADNVVRFYRPDNGGNGGSGHSPSPKLGPTGLSKDQALSDILERLTDGETIPSQDSLASDWGRSKQTVSDWMKDWRRIGVVPAPVRVGRFKMTLAG